MKVEELREKLDIRNHGIPLVTLDTQPVNKSQSYVKSILENEIRDIHVEHVATAASSTITDTAREGYKTIYLFVKGEGEVLAKDKSY